nr:hypothetical protein [uncultured Draconibacterium sp.]
MSEFKLTLLFLILSIAVNAQTRTALPKDYLIQLKTTEIKAEDYKIKKAITAYDLAMNLSFFHHLTQGSNEEYLRLPVISINDDCVEEKLLKEIYIFEIKDFQFESGIKTTALYGARGTYGHLKIYIEDKNHKN